MDRLEETTSLWVSVSLVVLATYVGGCAEPDSLPSPEEIARQYGAAVKTANREPTAALALVSALEVAPRRRVPLGIWREFTRRKRMEWLENDNIIVEPGPSPALVAALRKEIRAITPALAEIRKARALPAGLMPADLSPDRADQSIAKLTLDILTLSQRLNLAAILAVWEGRPRAAREFISDMITVDRAISGLPHVGAQATRAITGQTLSRTALWVAVNSGSDAKELECMVVALRDAEIDVADALSACLPYSRAWTLRTMDRVVARDPAAVTAVVRAYELHRNHVDRGTQVPSVVSHNCDSLYPANRVYYSRRWKTYASSLSDCVDGG